MKLSGIRKLLASNIIAIILAIVSLTLLLIWVIIDKENIEPYTVIPTALTSLLSYLSYKKGKEINIELLKDFQRQLKEINNEIELYRPETANRLLESLIKAIDQSTLRGKVLKELKAELYYSKGVCVGFLGISNEIYNSFIIALSFNPTQVKYIERACTSYYFRGDKSIGLKKAQELLQIDPTNPRAWIVKVLEYPQLDFDSVPYSARESITLKTSLTVRYINAGNYDFLDSRILSKVDLTERNIKIDYNNLTYWTIICCTLFNRELQNNPNDLLNRKTTTSRRTLCYNMSMELQLS